MGRLRGWVLLSILLLTFSCGEYQKIYKSDDFDTLYEGAMAYYDAGSYNKSSDLFEKLLPLVRATSKEPIVLYLYADCFYKMKQYTTAARYFYQFTKSFPQNERAEDAAYYAGYSNYKQAPKVMLDQELTNFTIKELSMFIEMYPNSARVEELNGYIAELSDRLVEKDYISAKLYYDLGNYMGNNYASAIIVAQNCLNDYPYTGLKEELNMLILRSRYAQAINSVQAKKLERYIATVDAYHSFKNLFPNPTESAEVEQMYEHAQSYIDKHLK